MRILVFIFCLSVNSCHMEALRIDKTSVELELVNGRLYYQNNLFTGDLILSNAEGFVEMELQYFDGRKHGYEKRWYANGQLAQSRNYLKGTKVGNHLGWWDDGKQKFDYNFNEKGEYEGSRKEWYSNGQLVRDFNYFKGKEIGNQRMWTKNGKIKANYVVKNGERFGLIGLKKCYTVNTNSNELQ